MEADDDGTYVVKFRGAGQGPKALVAELIAGEIGRALGLPVPEIVLVELDPSFARLEMDPEIQDLLRRSEGINVALDFLPGSISYDPLVPPHPDAAVASDVVWFDAFVSNVDRSARNTNLLDWHGRIWLIDHGAALYFHHEWSDVMARATRPFPQIRDHVLLPIASELEMADTRAHACLNTGLFEEIAAAVPTMFLESGFGDDAPDAVREMYLQYLIARLAQSNLFVEEAARARVQLV
jgi:hypothetical protein